VLFGGRTDPPRRNVAKKEIEIEIEIEISLAPWPRVSV